MRASLFGKVVEIYREYKSVNEYGQVITGTYNKVFRTRAEVKQKSGQFTVQNDNTVYTVLTDFTFRRYVDIREFDRIKYKDDFYRVLNITPDEKRQCIFVETEIVQD